MNAAKQITSIWGEICKKKYVKYVRSGPGIIFEQGNVKKEFQR
jgi:hypothetical protein